MSFTIFPGHNTFPEWNHWTKNRSGTIDKMDDSSLSTPTAITTTPMDSGENNSFDKMDNSLYKATNTQEAALDTKKAPKVKVTLSLSHTDKKHERSSSAPPPLTKTIQRENQTQISKLKSSLRQIELTPMTPSQQSPCSNKSVKFNPLHLEKVCLFEENQSPSEVPSFDQVKFPLFKVVYSQWPLLQNTLFHHQQNVQLKRSLKIIQGGSLLHGQVIVRNLGYEKIVEIRYTLDGWQTVKSIQATYLHGRGSLDIFAFDLDIQQGMTDRGHLRATIDMAVRYTVKPTNNNNHMEEKTFWDNNDGHNYQIQIVETAIKHLETISLPPPSDTSITLDELNDTGDDKYRLLSSPSTGSRYNFNRSLLKAKLHVNPSSIPPSPPPSPILPPSPPTLTTMLNSFTLNNDSCADTGFLSVEDNVRYISPPSSSNDALPMTSSSYSELVNKYCFYGSH